MRSYELSSHSEKFGSRGLSHLVCSGSLLTCFSKVVDLGSNSLIVITGPGIDLFNSIIVISFNWLITSGLARQKPATMLAACRPEVMLQYVPS